MPFFCFYGGKQRTAKYYPKPIHDTIIEPFAGSAGYSLYYSWKKILLFDIDPVICAIWKYLIRASREEILDLPLQISDVRDLPICQAAKWLIGFWLNKGTSTPCHAPSQWMRSKIRPNSYWGKLVRLRIANQVEWIKHWECHRIRYQQIENTTATWFIDPPYQKAGKHYAFGFYKYPQLSEWCRDRLGQTIVCEQSGADWLPFSKFRDIKSTPGKYRTAESKELVWYGE